MGGVASRETFEQILRKLSSEDVDPGDHQFWDEMWKTTLAVEVSDSVFLHSLHSLRFHWTIGWLEIHWSD